MEFESNRHLRKYFDDLTIAFWGNRSRVCRERQRERQQKIEAVLFLIQIGARIPESDTEHIVIFCGNQRCRLFRFDTEHLIFDEI